MTGPNGRPTRLSAVAALLLAIGAAAGNANEGLLIMALGGGGVVLFAIGIASPSRDLLSAGVVGIFIQTLLASLQGDPFQQVLGAAALLGAWHLGENAISLGGHVGRRAPTRHQELAAVGFVIVVGGVAAGLSLTVPTLSIPSLSVSGLTMAIVAVIFLGAAITD